MKSEKEVAMEMKMVMLVLIIESELLGFAEIFLFRIKRWRICL